MPDFVLGKGDHTYIEPMPNSSRRFLNELVFNPCEISHTSIPLQVRIGISGGRGEPNLSEKLIASKYLICTLISDR